ncbi:MAG TPA: DUF2182 domain-containing protein [Anaeromyxobacteraceae bacterium]|nr:DUF2182 domain-containing protein [Anaeromyxobacteraceae bacterium]
MMLPSLVPMLSGYRRSVHGLDEARLGALTAIAGAGYLAVWTALGAAVYPLGVALGAAEMRWHAVARAVPLATGVALVLGGCVQLTGWKARRLGHCRDAGCAPAPGPGLRGAWRHGLRLGLRCNLCCSGLVVALLVAGVMDLAVMAAVAVAITAERLAPWPGRIARLSGAAVVAAGALAIARAAR